MFWPSQFYIFLLIKLFSFVIDIAKVKFVFKFDDVDEYIIYSVDKSE